MNLSETLALLDKLNAIGAKHFKSTDFEVNLETWKVHMGAPTAVDTTNVVPEKPDTTSVVQPQSQDNTQKVQELIDLLKMKDEQLVNTIFPAGA